MAPSTYRVRGDGDLPPFSKLLVADRGAAAVRVIRAAHELGIETVAVHSVRDSRAYHVRLADEAVCIGPEDPRLSYGQMFNVLSAATTAGCDALHPGRSPLAHRAAFAEMCEKVGVEFIGPRVETLKVLEDTAAIRATLEGAEVDVAPSGVPTVFEVPILFDSHGNVIALPSIAEHKSSGGDLVFESPARASAGTLERAWSEAIKAVRALDFVGACSVSFGEVDGLALVNGLAPIMKRTYASAERASGSDVVKEQIRIAAGEPLSFSDDDLRRDRFVVGCSVVVEEGHDRPVESLYISRGNGLRWDGAAQEGDVLGPEAGPLGDLIANGRTREEAFARLRNALRASEVEGPRVDFAKLVSALDEAEEVL